MEFLTPITLSEPDVQISVLGHAIGKTSAGLHKANLLACYKDYPAGAADGTLAKSIFPNHPLKGHFENLYKSKCKNAKAIRRDVRKLHMPKCPYCGEAKEPIDIDHIAPRSIWPEYSLYSKNLVAVCRPCNSKKSNDYIDPKTGSRIFLNPYFDKFLSGHFIEVDVLADRDLGFDLPHFSVAPASSLDPKDSAQVQRHIDALDISARFGRYAQRLLRVWHEKWRGLGVPGLTDDLVRQHAAEVKVYGYNCWACLFYRAILKNNDLLNFLVR